MSIDQEIAAIVEAAKTEDYPAALEACTRLIERFPRAAEAWRHKAYVHALMKDYDWSVESMSQAIAIAPKEPGYFILRGRYYLMLGENLDATNDFTNVLTLSDQLDSDYYREAAHFLRAESYIRQGRFKEALSDCEHVRDEARMWIDSLRSKKDLIRRCTK